MKYRKKPVVIEAVQWTGSYKSTKEVIEFLGQKVTNDFVTQEKFEDYVSYIRTNGLSIETLEGNMRVSIGDYVIKGIQGEFYPCKPDIFEQTYEIAESK